MALYSLQGDTHGNDYSKTQEGRNLPVPHCIKGSHGWQIREELVRLRNTNPGIMSSS